MHGDALRRHHPLAGIDVVHVSFDEPIVSLRGRIRPSLVLSLFAALNTFTGGSDGTLIVFLDLDFDILIVLERGRALVGPFRFEILDRVSVFPNLLLQALVAELVPLRDEGLLGGDELIVNRRKSLAAGRRTLLTGHL